MIFSGVTNLHGVEFPIFLLIFAWTLQQCSATALPVINQLLFCSAHHKGSYLLRTEIC